jgi:hypothetical protein
MPDRSIRPPTWFHPRSSRRRVWPDSRSSANAAALLLPAQAMDSWKRVAACTEGGKLKAREGNKSGGQQTAAAAGPHNTAAWEQAADALTERARHIFVAPPLTPSHLAAPSGDTISCKATPPDRERALLFHPTPPAAAAPRTQAIVPEPQHPQARVSRRERRRNLLAASLGYGAAPENEALQELAGRLPRVEQLRGGRKQGARDTCRLITLSGMVQHARVAALKGRRRNATKP